MKFRGLPEILFFQNFVWNLNIYLSSSSSKVEYKKIFLFIPNIYATSFLKLKTNQMSAKITTRWHQVAVTQFMSN